VKRTDIGPFTTPHDNERERTLVEIHRRETDIDHLKAGIRVLRFQQRQRDHEEHERIRPILDELHTQIITLQEKMAVHWRNYQTRIMQRQRETERVIGGIQSKVQTLEQENSYAASLLAPIRRLPTEMLSEIFTIAIMVYKCSSLRLMSVCRSWRLVLMTMSRIWSTIKVRTWTRTDFIKFLLERTRRVTLDIEIDTDSDSGFYIADPSRSYAALAMVAKTSTRWKNLTIRSFPREVDLMNSEALGSLLVFEGPMEALENLRITGPCEMNTAITKLIILARSISGPQLKTLELSIYDALVHFATPPSSLLRHLRSFKVDFADMKDPLDILPQFERLEDLHAHRLHLPLYSDTTNLPLVHTLKRLFLKNTSVQWMQGRSFSKLLDCTVMWPHLPDALLTGVQVHLPVCTHLTYDDHILQPLTIFDLPLLDALVVRNEAWNRPRGSQQLGFIWGPIVPTEKILRPRVLHLDTQCYDQHLISALKTIPEVEELILGLVRPDALGKKFLSSLLAKRVRENSVNIQTRGHENASVTRTSPAWVVSLCPNLKALGFKYRRWLRQHESDEITTIFQEIVDTRAKSNTPLRSFKFWPTKETTDQEAKELVDGRVIRGQL
jgi:hypothetical protein